MIRFNADRLHAYRLRQSMTPAAFARFLGVRPAALRQWESGKAAPSFRLFCRILERLHARADGFLVYDGWEKLPRGRRKRAAAEDPPVSAVAESVGAVE